MTNFRETQVATFDTDGKPYRVVKLSARWDADGGSVVSVTADGHVMSEFVRRLKDMPEVWRMCLDAAARINAARGA